MAQRVKKFFSTAVGKVLLAVIYLVMLWLVLSFYTGNGAFIYEAF